MAGRVCLCISDEPLAADEIRGRYATQYARYYENQGTFQVPMVETVCGAGWRTGCCCLVAALPPTWSCVQLHMRYQVLNHLEPGSGWKNYACCQGYVPPCLCFQPGQCCERDAPRTCMFIEALCCPGFAVSSTRFLLLDHYSLRPDPCDNKIIRINNCIQLLACVCDIAAHFDRNLRDLSALLDLLADLVFLATSACMTAQVWYEMKARDAGSSSYDAVATVEAVALNPVHPEDPIRPKDDDDDVTKTLKD